MTTLQRSGLTESIICSFYNVYNRLGYGFLEKVYQNALLIELNKIGLSTLAQAPISVSYEDQVVSACFADILVQNQVIVEVKAANTLTSAHEAQLLKYLKATGFEVGLLLNFGPEPQVKRKINTKEQSVRG